MNKLVASVLSGLAIMSPGVTLAATRPEWRPARDAVIEGPSLNNPDTSNGIAIYTGNRSIIIITDHRVEVRVFTILGQSVSHDEIPPGASILKINTRGIYIVKIENITQKVAL